MKPGSRLASLALFTVTLLAWSSVARADRVVLYPVGGRADEDRLEEIEDRIGDVIRALGHEVITPPGGLRDGTRPSTAAELGGIATASGATYVVVAEVEPLRGQYRLHLVVGYQPTQRVEELVVTVLASEEEARLRDVLGAMLRPEGLGEDAVRLTGGIVDPEAEAAERRRREEEARAAADAEEAERRAREEEEARRAEEERQRAADEAARAEEERAAREREAWDARLWYGRDGEWLVLVGGGGGYLAAFGGDRGGGGIGTIQARLGRFFPGTDGLELRGGLDVVLGAVGAIDIVLGASWQFSPFVEPIRIGPLLEIGASFTFTGAQDAGFLARVGAVASWAPVRQLQIEATLPELGVITNGPGAFVVGASARVGYRFD
ncbi:hypothetical protein [Sandaracinus amylolyticus]|uniref:hypothetical protein n=1 Tax=Sandaracinus amylolyticus TaxID=927083 RepID=UPI001F45DF38|nr:hypothetical protein [Sandaracinus amylolyticus]UJR86757.1 Hypothetical protein I5071_88580 [Sandaracinus amylolyticus]